MSEPGTWPKPFKVLNAHVGTYNGNWDRMVDDFENMLMAWDAAGFRLYAGGFHPDGGTFWALMVKKR
jgi:hypothetical protein